MNKASHFSNLHSGKSSSKLMVSERYFLISSSMSLELKSRGYCTINLSAYHRVARSKLPQVLCPPYRMLLLSKAFSTQTPQSPTRCSLLTSKRANFFHHQISSHLLIFPVPLASQPKALDQTFIAKFPRSNARPRVRRNVTETLLLILRSASVARARVFVYK